MNYNANAAVRHGAPRKPKRVSDVNAMGTSVPSPAQPSFNPYTPYGVGIQNVSQSNFGAPPGYEYQAPYATSSPYTGVPPQQPIPSQQGHFSMLSQPVVQDMAFQYGQELANTGRNVVKKEFEKYVPVSRLKYYFAVDTQYVLTKLGLLFFPFTHKDWSIKYEQDNPVQPRFEINAPDLYIPVMAYVTYVVVAGLVLGMQDRFTPEQIGIYASSALAWCIVEIAIYMATLYITNIQTTLKTLDLIAYSGYKYVGIIASVMTSLVFAKTGYYIALIYCSIALAFFLVRALKAQVLLENQTAQHYGSHTTGSKRRLYFLLFVAITQPLLSWWLSLHLIG